MNEFNELFEQLLVYYYKNTLYNNIPTAIQITKKLQILARKYNLDFTVKSKLIWIRLRLNHVPSKEYKVLSNRHFDLEQLETIYQYI